MLEDHFLCVHTIQFSEPGNIGSLKTDRVNRPQVSLYELVVRVSSLLVVLRYVCV